MTQDRGKAKNNALYQCFEEYLFENFRKFSEAALENDMFCYGTFPRQLGEGGGTFAKETCVPLHDLCKVLAKELAEGS